MTSRCLSWFKEVRPTALVQTKAHFMDGFRCKRALTVKVLNNQPLIIVMRLVFAEIFALEVIIARFVVVRVIVRRNERTHKTNSNYERIK